MRSEMRCRRRLLVRHVLPPTFRSAAPWLLVARCHVDADLWWETSLKKRVPRYSNAYRDARGCIRKRRPRCFGRRSGYGREHRLSAAMFYACFRFHRKDVPGVVARLGLPAVIQAAEGVRIDGEEGLLIFLRRLAYPARWRDLEVFFSRSESVLKKVFDAVREHVLWPAVAKLEEFDVGAVLPWIRTFESAIALKGAPFAHCWGFLDGTFRAMSRPGENGYRGPLQRAFYNAYKKNHGVEFLGIVTPDGIIREANGPHAGSISEHTIVKNSNVLERLANLNRALGHFAYVYADAGFYVHRYRASGLLSATPLSLCRSDVDRQLNTIMSPIRVPVEWAFGKVISLFAFLDYSKSMQLGKVPVGSLWLIAAFLTNVHSCLYGSQTSHYFGVPAPDLRDYLPLPSRL